MGIPNSKIIISKNIKLEKDYILQKIKDENFLIKQNTTDNSAIPYQLNELELIKILENQKER